MKNSTTNKVQASEINLSKRRKSFIDAFVAGAMFGVLCPNLSKNEFVAEALKISDSGSKKQNRENHIDAYRQYEKSGTIAKAADVMGISMSVAHYRIKKGYQICLKDGSATIDPSAYYKSKRKNLIGMKFGLLTVKSGPYKENGKVVWDCVCSCGGECVVKTHALIHGKRTSCGCAWGSKQVAEIIEDEYDTNHI